VEEVGTCVNPNRCTEMEGANGKSNWTTGYAKYLPICMGGITFQVHAHVVEHAPFCLLLSRLFLNLLLCRLEELPDGNLKVSICDPCDRSQCILVPSRPRKVQVGSFKILSYVSLPASHQNSPCALSSLTASTIPSFPRNSTTTLLVYKKVARKVQPVTANLPEDF